MNSTITSYFILLLICFTSYQNSYSQDVLFAPKNAKKYHFELGSNSLILDFNISCHYYHKEQSVEMVTIVDKTNYKGNSDVDKEVNADYNRYVGDSFLTVFDTYGHANAALKSPKRLINAELFVVELPQQPIQVGDSWTGKKSANPDLFFDYMETKYTCKKITDTEITIYAELTCKREKEDYPALKSLTKFYKGYYIIEKDGTLKSADLTISGFSGLSNISGAIKINELP